MICVVSINRGFLKDFRLNGPSGVQLTSPRSLHLATECRLPNVRTENECVFFLFFFRRPERPKTNRTDGRACFVLNNYRYDLRVEKRTRARGPPGPACVIEILIGRRTCGNRYGHNRLRYVHPPSLSRTVWVQGVLSSTVGRDPTGEKFGTRPSVVVTGCDGPEDVFALRLTWATEC